MGYRREQERVILRPSQLPLPPADLADMVKDLRTVKRNVSPNYPPTIFKRPECNVYHHTCAAVAIVQSLSEFGGVDWQEAERTLWIHDLHERVTGDTVVVWRDNSVEKLQIEWDACEDLLSKQDFLRWQKLYTAKWGLKNGGLGEGIEVDPCYAMAGVIDSVEGNIGFHEYVTDALVQGFFLGEWEKRMESAFRHTWNQSAKYWKNLPSISVPDVSELGHGVLVAQIGEVKRLWRRVPVSRIPLVMRSYLGIR